jgi:glycosyltransferase involved in cell wall biosynthesis
MTSILYLSYDGLTDPLGQSQILPYLAGLADAGYAITIVSFEKPDRYKALKSVIEKICREHSLQWEPLLYHKSPPVASTLYDVYQLQTSAVMLHKQRNFSIVHCRSYITALAGMWLKRKYGLKFIFDMRGFWADERVEGGLWKLDNPVYRSVYKFFKKKEKQFLMQADAVIVLTHAAKKEIESWQLAKRIDVIPCCVDLELFDRKNIDQDKRKLLQTTLGLTDDHYVLLYLGSIGTWYLWEEMKNYFSELKKNLPSAKFLIITPDVKEVPAHPDYIVRTAKRDEVPAYINLANASICFIKPSFSKKGSSATKIAEVLAMGVPVLTNAGWGDVEFMQEKLGNFRVLKKLDDVVIPKTDIFFMENSFFQDFFSLKSGIAKYKMVYQSI